MLPFSVPYFCISFARTNRIELFWILWILALYPLLHVVSQMDQKRHVCDDDVHTFWGDFRESTIPNFKADLESKWPPCLKIAKKGKTRLDVSPGASETNNLFESGWPWKRTSKNSTKILPPCYSEVCYFQ